MSDALTIEGTVADEFVGVLDAFADNFRRYGDVGASVAVYVDGELKVDLWGGLADAATKEPWREDTIGIVYSVTKGATALLGHVLAERGILDLDAPVASYWPEFAAAGKSEVPVRQLFTHQAGLPCLEHSLSRTEILAGERVADMLAAQAPEWEPGTAHGYHALTYGWLIGKVIRRVTGHTLGEAFHELIAAPLALDFHIGLPDSEVGRVATLLPQSSADPSIFAAGANPQLMRALAAAHAAAQDPRSTYSRALSMNGALPTPDAATWNDPRVYRSELPAANGITNARSLARMYAAMVGAVSGVRLLTDGSVAQAKVEQAHGQDMVLLLPTRTGTGFRLPSWNSPMLSSESLGHAGAGGALGFADTRHRVGFGYVQNKLGGGPSGDRRTAGLIAAVRDALGA